MKKLFLPLFVLMLSNSVLNCQEEWKKHIVPGICVFVSGMCEGIQDWSAFHNSGGSQFWDGSISWKNKYKNHDPSQGKTFAGKYFVFLTDGFHLMKFSKNLSMFTGFTLILNKEFSGKKKWYWYIVEGASYWAINRLGFVVTYNLIFK